MGLSRDIGAMELAGLTAGVAADGIQQLRVTVLPDGRMSAESAAIYLGISKGRLATWRMEGIGPRWLRVGGRIFYRREDLDTFIAEGRENQPIDS